MIFYLQISKKTLINLNYHRSLPLSNNCNNWISVDLSAAFDLLRPKTFMRSLMGIIDEDLIWILWDFLTERTMHVEVDGQKSSTKKLTLGCVQGSVLGPKLFNLYMRSVADHVEGNVVTAYADDTYVLVKGDSTEEIISRTKSCISTHLKYLQDRGMVTNLTKTEAVVFGKESTQANFSIDGESFSTGETMKILGVTFDDKLTFSQHVQKVIQKSKCLNSAMKLIRQKLTLDQFLRVLTCQFYSKVYYGSSSWLHGLNSFVDKRLLNAMHYRAIRIAIRDHAQRVSRTKLDELGRCRPSTWGKYVLSSMAVKVVRRREPIELYEKMMKNSYVMRRKINRYRFRDTSTLKVGRLMTKNRLTILNEFDCEWLLFSDDKLRIELKKSLKMTSQASGGFSPG